MTIVVRYLAQVRQAAGRSGEEVVLDAPCHLSDVLRHLAERHDEPFRRLLLDPAGRVQTSLLLFVGDQQVGEAGAVPLKDGDEITVLTPMAGG